MAVAKKQIAEDEVEFRSKYQNLHYVIEPPQIGANIKEKGVVVVFGGGQFKTKDSDIIENLREAMTRAPGASDLHGLKGIVEEVPKFEDIMPPLDEDDKANLE